MTSGLGPGRVAGIAVRSAKKGPMRELSRATAKANGGLVEDIRVSPRRGLTLLSLEQWRETLAELNTELPWHTRRANLLIEGLWLPDCIGRRLAVGEVWLDILGETKPCELMNEYHPGLEQALRPGVRAGVHGRVVRGGEIAVGASVEAAPEEPLEDGRGR